MSEMKKVILYAIIPELIAGLFALLPKIYDEINEPKANLQYSFFKGPLLKVNNKYKTIVSIEIENTGKKVLSNIITIIEPYAVIESISLTNSMGLEQKVKNEGIIKVTEKIMHPNDKITISLMLSSNSNIVSPNVTLRADEVIGSIKTTTNKNSISISSGLLSAFSVFIMSLTFIIKSKFGTRIPTPLSRMDNIYYISTKIKNDNLIKSIHEYNGNLTYLRFSDIILYLYNNNEIEKNIAISILKCLLLINEIATSTKGSYKT
ncbi:hypothetical protein [Photobacterium leiognathi]|uniref:hypothetical protein n=1 Tax=Photobacterium leiognathi TaxID=553611 RepID=UPI002732987E|nr:hypothetical protein [Photobacterium leiognathi]